MKRLLPLLALLLNACMNYGPGRDEPLSMTGRRVVVVNEGNFGYGNATLCCYDPAARQVENEVFRRANAIDLGDVAQSAALHEGRLYVVVNNSGVVFVVDPDSFEVLGTVEKLTSPRYIHFVDASKAYITDLYSPLISILDPATLRVTGHIDTRYEGRERPSTEQMVQWGDYVFVNCWSYDNRILVIDTRTDEVVDAIETGIQPASMVVDRRGKIWCVTDGGYPGSPYGYEAPALLRIDARTRRVEARFDFSPGDRTAEVAIDPAGEVLYYINRHVWAMQVTDERLPLRPLIVNDNDDIWYGLAVDPASGEIYVADAIDYQQQGVVYRYSAAGELLDTFRAGITPASFCFK